MPRVGDRQRDASWKIFSRAVVDGIVSAMRSAVQISFYICDYSTKPNVTSGRVLQYMHKGMQRLEAELQEKECVQKVLELEAAGFLDDPGRLPSGVQTLEGKNLSEAEKRQEKVRRILIRLWSAANYSYLKGASLQLVHLLTRREAFRTHKYWQVLTKRLIWAGLFSCWLALPVAQNRRSKNRCDKLFKVLVIVKCLVAYGSCVNISDPVSQRT